MTKLHKASTALLLSAALLLAGCAERSPVPGTETSSSSDNSSDNSSSEFMSTDNNSSEVESSNPTKSAENSSEPETEKIPVKFTKEDREFQEMLKPIAEGCDQLNVWYSRDAAYDSYRGGNRLFEAETFQFPELVNPYSGKICTSEFFRLPNGYLDSENALPIPNTYEDVRNIMLKYLTENYADGSYWFVNKGTKSENSDRTYNIILENKNAEWCSKLLEINGVMYRQSGVGGKDAFTSIEVPTAKIVSKTDDTIVFTFCSYPYGPHTAENGDPIYSELDDINEYNKHAYTGVLKYERGGWRRDKDKADS